MEGFQRLWCIASLGLTGFLKRFWKRFGRLWYRARLGITRFCLVKVWTLVHQIFYRIGLIPSWYWSSKKILVLLF